MLWVATFYLPLVLCIFSLLACTVNTNQKSNLGSQRLCFLHLRTRHSLLCGLHSIEWILVHILYCLNLQAQKCILEKTSCTICSSVIIYLWSCFMYTRRFYILFSIATSALATVRQCFFFLFDSICS